MDLLIPCRLSEADFAEANLNETAKPRSGDPPARNADSDPRFPPSYIYVFHNINAASIGGSSR
jgi:hypothetical protein